MDMNHSWPFSRWTWISRYQNVSILDFIEAKDDGSVQSFSQIITNNKPTPAVTGRVSFLSPN